jgi:hypothetical protein
MALVLPACNFPGDPTPPPTGTGAFSGIFAWGNGGNQCTESQTSTTLTIDCFAVRSNFIGSYTLIHFPSKNFRAVVQVKQGSDPQFGIEWTEQDTAVLTPTVYNHGLISGSQSVTLTGASVQFSNDWDLGLDSFRVNGGFPGPADATITITRI